MTTTNAERSRILEWANCLNCRDLGGYPTADGRETRWGAVVRCDNPALLTPAGADAVIEYGIKTVVDLRRPEEIERHPHPFRESRDGIEYVNISLVDPAASWPPHPFQTLSDDYVAVLTIFPDQIAEIVRAVGLAEPGGVAINCMGGKDRTGLISALLLGLCGVPDEVIAADYAITGERLRPRDIEYLEHGPGERAERERLLAFYTPKAEVMQAVLDHLRDRLDGVEGYLRQSGVTADEIASIGDRLVEG